ncbi:unnamed protein product [Arctia plantaginis]|uniref:Uncharacterized protein n=1 Tax=Arctia plantaginis TaxID=874455 RepID=A0A8S1AQ56_ARCPL|nr:unnamed protein product [Arctia plantaginis]
MERAAIKEKQIVPVQRIENENEESHQSTSDDQIEPNNETIAQPAIISDMDLLQNIRPIPIGTVRKSTRGRKSQKSEILNKLSYNHSSKTKKKILQLQKEKLQSMSQVRPVSKDNDEQNKPWENPTGTRRKKIGYNVGSVKSGHMKPVLHIRDAVHIFATIVLIKMRFPISIRFARPEYSFCPPSYALQPSFSATHPSCPKPSRSLPNEVHTFIHNHGVTSPGCNEECTCKFEDITVVNWGMVSLGLGDERKGAAGVRFWGIIDWGPHHQHASGAARMSRATPWDRVTRVLRGT